EVQMLMVIGIIANVGGGQTHQGDSNHRADRGEEQLPVLVKVPAGLPAMSALQQRSWYRCQNQGDADDASTDDEIVPQPGQQCPEKKACAGRLAGGHLGKETESFRLQHDQKQAEPEQQRATEEHSVAAAGKLHDSCLRPQPGSSPTCSETIPRSVSTLPRTTLSGTSRVPVAPYSP